MLDDLRGPNSLRYGEKNSSEGHFILFVPIKEKVL